MTERRTIDWFEWARAIGALAIVALHAVRATELADGLVAANPALFWWEGLLQIPLARWVVPVFFMISGALILDPAREMPPRKIGRYVWRMAFVLLTIGLAFCVVEQVADVVQATGSYAIALSAWPGVLGRSLLNLFEGKSWDHLWYLYALIGLYLLTPFVKAYLRDADRGRLRRTICIAWVLLCLIPLVNFLLNTNIYQYVDLSCAVVYFLVGHYAYAYMRLDRRVVVAGFASLAACCLPSVLGLGTINGTLIGGSIALPQYGLVLPFSVMVLLAFRRWLDIPLDAAGDRRGHPLVRGLARDSFGIYLIHPLFGHLAIWFLDYQAIPVSLLQLGIVAVGVVGSVAVTRALRLLPGFRDKL